MSGVIVHEWLQSTGGAENVFDVLGRLRGVLFRSMTTNGLLLHGETWDCLFDTLPPIYNVKVAIV